MQRVPYWLDDTRRLMRWHTEVDEHKPQQAYLNMLPSAAAVPTCASRPAAIMWLMSGTASCPSTSSWRPRSVPSPPGRAGAATADAVKVSSSAPATAAAADGASCSLPSASLGDSASPSCSSAARTASSAACSQFRRGQFLPQGVLTGLGRSRELIDRLCSTSTASAMHGQLGRQSPEPVD